MSIRKSGIFWFRNDLRLSDNPALNSLTIECDEVVFVYILDPELFKETEFGQSRLGLPRWKFIQECIVDLQKQLQAFQQNLIIKVGEPIEVLSDLINTHQINHIGVTPLSGVYEKSAVETLKLRFKNKLNWHCEESFTLFDQDELPFTIDNLPDGFSPFRKKIEKTLKPETATRKIVTKPEQLPSVITEIQSDSFHENLLDINRFHNPIPSMKHQGGEQAAKEQLNFYCHQSEHLSQYKETRNGLDGWDFSSKLSAYLAQGCISPRQVMVTVLDYENKFRANQSTYWLYFELLWREFYQWHQEKYYADMYLERGIQGIDTGLSFDPVKFDSWIKGNTSSDFVNAFMRQIKLTGWMSNRGRQVVASFFVNHLQLDWRYGATWFEHQLVDYDPASNWGNWQYLAGVGVDPRGRRAFNIEKQRQIYDPEGLFIQKYTKDDLI